MYSKYSSNITLKKKMDEQQTKSRMKILQEWDFFCCLQQPRLGQKTL